MSQPHIQSEGNPALVEYRLQKLEESQAKITEQLVNIASGVTEIKTKLEIQPTACGEHKERLESFEKKLERVNDKVNWITGLGVGIGIAWQVIKEKFLKL